MNEKHRAELAWLIWQMVDEISTILWDHYEHQFLNFCKKEHEERRSDFKKSCTCLDESSRDVDKF